MDHLYIWIVLFALFVMVLAIFLGQGALAVKQREHEEYMIRLEKEQNRVGNLFVAHGDLVNDVLSAVNALIAEEAGAREVGEVKTQLADMRQELKTIQTILVNPLTTDV